MESELVEALDGLSTLLEAGRSGRARRSAALEIPKRTFQRLLRQMWRKQRIAVLKAPELQLLKDVKPLPNVV